MSEMNESFEAQETHMQTMAAAFDYPATPEVAAVVRARLTEPHGRQPKRIVRLAWAMALVLLILVGLLMVPSVRAAVLRLFHIGAITIFELDDSEAVLETAVITANKPSITPLVPAEFARELSPDELKVLSLYLPNSPSNLAAPDRVYQVDPAYDLSPTFISIWQDEGLALYQIGVTQFAWKGATIVQETAVNGQQAAWIQGPHGFWLQNGQVQTWQYVAGNVLIWWHEDGLTFRLEGADSLAEALRMAESLQKMEE